MTVFITGKVGKHPEKATRERFKEMEKDLKAKGYTNFFYPARLEDDCTLSKEECIKADITLMLNTQSLMLDTNWHTSKRSILLRDIALRVGIDILHRH